MRNIKYIVIHCTATPQDTTIESIKKYWKNNLGWKNYGYHYIIPSYSNMVQLTNINNIANGVQGYNTSSIHISYIGGIDDKGKPADTRTENQKYWLKEIIKELKQQFPNAEVKGHRDFPDVHKACPSFDVKTWLKEENI